MQCPHCLLEIHDSSHEYSLSRHGYTAPFSVRVDVCPSCKKYFCKFRADGEEVFRFVYPKVPSRKAIPKSVPADIARDYTEAVEVIASSAKASAALSRRCLQNILSRAGYTSRDLVKQVKDFIEETDPRKAPPSALIETVDAVRNFGNFSAHPIDDKTTLQVVDVDPEEAEWCLDILEEMFDHFFEKPAIAAEKKAKLNAKLAAAGRPAAQG